MASSKDVAPLQPRGAIARSMGLLLKTAICVVVAALAMGTPAIAEQSKRAKKRPVAAPAKAVMPALARDGQAEARLVEIYRLIGQSRGRAALAQAESLVKEHPNFQLAQLVYGDLLASQTRPLLHLGDVPDIEAKSSATLLAELREESQQRMRALRERPPVGAVPSQFLSLSTRTKHAIAVDASRSRLYLFENSATGLKLVGDYYASVGKLGVDKGVEGDQRTPLGVYFITSNLDPKTLRDFYGSGALPINYPNAYDARRGKTGSGIWLHGTPPDQFARAPKATDGCIALSNPDLDRIIRTVEVRTTPFVIAQTLQWVAPQSVRAESQVFESTLQAWRQAKSSGDVASTLAFYAADFSSSGKSLQEWTPRLRKELEQARGRGIELKDLTYLRWKDSNDTMVVTFGEVLVGDRSGTTKRQYWVRQGPHWKIFFEGTIG